MSSKRSGEDGGGAERRERKRGRGGDVLFETSQEEREQAVELKRSKRI